MNIRWQHGTATSLRHSACCRSLGVSCWTVHMWIWDYCKANNLTQNESAVVRSVCLSLIAMCRSHTPHVQTTLAASILLSSLSGPPGYDNKDCPGQVTYSVGQVKISVACPTGQVVISFFKSFYWQYHISIQALGFESLWQFLFCGSTIATSVSLYIIKPTDFRVVACDWFASAVKPIRS